MPKPHANATRIEGVNFMNVRTLIDNLKEVLNENKIREKVAAEAVIEQLMKITGSTKEEAAMMVLDTTYERLGIYFLETSAPKIPTLPEMPISMKDLVKKFGMKGGYDDISREVSDFFEKLLANRNRAA